MPTRDPFEKKTVYHSALVKEGRIEITITCDKPQKSKYNNQPDYISFKLDGNEHFYPIENDRCGDALSGLKGETVEIEASGGRDDADIEVIGGGGSGRREERHERREEPRRETRREEPRREERRQEQRPPEKHRRTKEEREEDEDKAFRKARIYAAQCSVLMQVALKAAENALSKHFHPNGTDQEPDYSAEDVRATGNTIFIDLKSTTDLTKLPVLYPVEKPKQEEWQPERRPSKERAPDREPEPRREEPPPQRRDDPEADLDEQDIPF